MTDLRQRLRRYGLRPRKGLGQHFLAWPQVLDRIADAAELQPHETVLEIGPGLGDLTARLAQRAARVVAVEVDPRMRWPLAEVQQAHPNIEVVFGDILQHDPAALVGSTPYVVVANLPYNITAAVTRHVLQAEPRPARLVLLVQREVAERMAAAPPRMSLLTLLVQLYGQPRVLFRVPPAAFVPRPKVESAVVRIDMLPTPRVPEARLPLFWRLARAAFAQKRKQVRNSLAAGLRLSKAEVQAWLQRARVEPTARAEALDWDAWQRLLATAPIARLGGEATAARP